MEDIVLKKKLNHIEQELEELKKSLLLQSQLKAKKVVSLKGLLSGLKITEEDVMNAKKSLFSAV